MTGQIESLLEKGIEAAQAEEKARARDIFFHVIELDEHNERAWLWLSSVVATESDKEICLENVLAINPDNTYAAMGLQHLRLQPKDPFCPPSALPRLLEPAAEAEGEWNGTRAEAGAVASPPPAERVCPGCGFRNPGWAYLCDRCGANLRRLDVRAVVRESATARDRSIATLLEAWGGVLTFDRLYAFKPEVELASWGRSLAALIVGAILATGLRVITTTVVPILVNRGGYDLENRLVTDALHWTGQTLWLTLLVILMWGIAASAMWGGARLMGGKCPFKVHAHLVAVAISAWNLLGAAFSALIVLTPYLLARVNPINLPFEQVFDVAGIAVGAVAFIWLAQATREAHEFTSAKAFSVAIAAEGLGALLLLALNLLTGGAFAESMGALLITYFLPWLPLLG